MSNQAGRVQFRLFRSGGRTPFVAVPSEYLVQLDEYAEQFGGLQNVPADKTVRGIFVDDDRHMDRFDPSAQQNDIPVCTLSYYTEK